MFGAYPRWPDLGAGNVCVWSYPGCTSVVGAAHGTPPTAIPPACYFSAGVGSVKYLHKEQRNGAFTAGQIKPCCFNSWRCFAKSQHLAQLL